ncbi:MAG: hypothetical protein IJ800_01875 [Clostridia bacterium]|nr:hypothetical protein [Clostridia bacterium]
MNKIDLLNERRSKLLAVGEDIRKAISDIADENSFVELDAFSFSRNEFYGEDAEGEGVVTGYATIDDTPVYIIAQNVKVLSGGVSVANCGKIRKCLDRAYEAGYPVIYLFDSLGVRVGEGVNVLEGIGGVLSASCELKGEVPQFSIVLGELYGSFALLAANADMNFIVKDSKMGYASPTVIASSDKNLSVDDIAGFKNASFAGNITAEVESVLDARAKIIEVLSVIPGYSGSIADTTDDLNRVSENLNDKVCPECLVKAVFDEGKFIEFNSSFAPEVKTGIGRIGGISAASILFGGEDKGVELNLNVVLKIKEFADFASAYSLPLVIFVNTLGIKTDPVTARSPIMKEINNMIAALKCCDRLSVVYGKAIGLGYSIFASKSIGVDYSYAFANAKIALFDGKVSAVAFGRVKEEAMDALAEKYAEENADPINAAKNGYVDNIIEPQFARQYIISALQMLVR